MLCRQNSAHHVSAVGRRATVKIATLSPSDGTILTESWGVNHELSKLKENKQTKKSTFSLFQQ